MKSAIELPPKGKITKGADIFSRVSLKVSLMARNFTQKLKLKVRSQLF